MTPQSPAPVAGDEFSRPASEQPVEAIGAGREGEAAGPPREPTQTMMDALLYHSSADTTWGDAYTMWTAAHDAWFRDGPAALSPASPARTPRGERGDVVWRDVKDAPQDGTNILLKHRVHGIIEGWFSKGEWTDDTPISPREYTGDMWILGDDLDQEEVEFGPNGEILAGSVEGWLPLDALAAPTPMGGEVEALREALIQADLKIRSLPGTDQSDVEFIRQALAASSPSPAQGGRPSDEQVRRAIQTRLHLHPTDETLGCLDRAVADIQALFAPPFVQPVEGK